MLTEVLLPGQASKVVAHEDKKVEGGKKDDKRTSPSSSSIRTLPTDLSRAL